MKAGFIVSNRREFSENVDKLILRDVCKKVKFHECFEILRYSNHHFVVLLSKKFQIYLFSFIFGYNIENIIHNTHLSDWNLNHMQFDHDHCVILISRKILITFHVRNSLIFSMVMINVVHTWILHRSRLHDLFMRMTWLSSWLLMSVCFCKKINLTNDSECFIVFDGWLVEWLFISLSASWPLDFRKSNESKSNEKNRKSFTNIEY